MSHSVTITRTVTSSNTTSTLILNTGYLKTVPGLLKLFQLVQKKMQFNHFFYHIRIIVYYDLQILGAVCVGIVAWYHRRYSMYGIPDLFFLLMTTAFVIGTFCLLVSCLFSLSTGGIISKTIYVSAQFLAGNVLIFKLHFLGIDLPFGSSYITFGWCNNTSGGYQSLQIL